MKYIRFSICLITALMTCVFPVLSESAKGSLQAVATHGAAFRSVNWNARIQEAVDSILQDNLLDDLGALVGFETRFSYSSQSHLAASWLENEFSSVGYITSFHEHDRTMSPNVAAEKPGIKTPEEIVLVCAHFDTVTSTPMEFAPGANNNGSGTAAMLSIARALSDMHFDRTIRFVAFSGSEQGLRGSRVYAQRAAIQNETIVAVVNLDMIGQAWGDEKRIEIITNSASETLADYLISCAGLYTTLTTEKIVNSSLTWSDHASFWTEEFPAILVTHDQHHQYPYYHSTDDTIDKIEPEYLVQTARAAAAVMAHIAAPRTDMVYIYNAHLDDSSGNGDGFLNPGETVDIFVEIMNASDESSGPIQLNLLCLSGSRYVTVLSGSVTLPTLQPGEKTDTRNQPFVVRVRPEVPEFTFLTCIVTLTCDAPHSAGYIFHEIITTYRWNDSIVLYDMTENPGWSLDDGWKWDKPSGQGGENYGWPNPDSGNSGEKVLGTWPEGDYPPGMNVTATSPVLDFSHIRLAELHFQRWLNVEKPAFDKARIWIINDEGKHKIWENPHEMTDNQWHAFKINISEWADARDAVQIQFELDSDDKWEYSGWNLDDIRIAGLTVPQTSPSPEIPDNTIGVFLSMPVTILTSGDLFELNLWYWNTTVEPLSGIPLFVILDIDGAYWFWPNWTTSFNHDTTSMPPGHVSGPDMLVQFVWPDVDGNKTGLRFWAAFTRPDISEILGDYSMIEWSYN